MQGIESNNRNFFVLKVFLWSKQNPLVIVSKLYAVCTSTCCLSHSPVVLFSSLVGVGGKVLGRVLVAVEDVEVVAIDLDVSSHWHFCWQDETHLLVHVLILSSLKEGTLDDAGVLLCGLEDRNCVISEVERDDESSVHVLGNLRIESCSVSKDLFIVVHVFEEINFWLLGN